MQQEVYEQWKKELESQLKIKNCRSQIIVTITSQTQGWIVSAASENRAGKPWGSFKHNSFPFNWFQNDPKLKK